MPVLGALFVRKPGVQNRDLVSEDFVNIGGDRGREPDFRYQQDRRSPRIEHRLHSGEIYSGFSRSGDTMQQNPRKLPRINQSANLTECRLLRGIELHSRWKNSRVYGGFRQLDRFGDYFD